jgi:hypothetical protein
MASMVTLTELELSARRLADVETDLKRFPQAEVWDYINRAIKHFHTELLRVRGQGYSLSDTFITTSQGVEMYGLPATFLQATKVWTIVDGRERVLRGYEPYETDGIRDQVSWDSPLGEFSRWRLVGDNISLRPTPPSSKTVFIRYVTTLVKLTSGSNTIDGIDGFDEFIVAWAARRMAIKDNKMELVGTLSQDIQDTLERLRVTWRSRNAAEPVRMLDTRGDTEARHYGRNWMTDRGSR